MLCIANAIPSNHVLSSFLFPHSIAGRTGKLPIVAAGGVYPPSLLCGAASAFSMEKFAYPQRHPKSKRVLAGGSSDNTLSVDCMLLWVAVCFLPNGARFPADRRRGALLHSTPRVDYDHIRFRQSTVRTYAVSSRGSLPRTRCPECRKRVLRSLGGRGRWHSHPGPD